MSDLLLRPDEMLQPIWEMGERLEKEGKEPTQLERFKAIAKAQHDRILNELLFIAQAFTSKEYEIPLKGLIARMMKENDKEGDK